MGALVQPASRLVAQSSRSRPSVFLGFCPSTSNGGASHGSVVWIPTCYAYSVLAQSVACLDCHRDLTSLCEPDNDLSLIVDLNPSCASHGSSALISISYASHGSSVYFEGDNLEHLDSNGSGRMMIAMRLVAKSRESDLVTSIASHYQH